MHCRRLPRPGPSPLPRCGHRLPAAPGKSAVCGMSCPAAEVDVEASYLLDDSSSAASGAPSRLSRIHSRVPSTGSAASWDSSLPAHSHSSSRTGLALDAQGAYVEASVGRMLSAGRDRCGTLHAGLWAGAEGTCMLLRTLVLPCIAGCLGAWGRLQMSHLVLNAALCSLHACQAPAIPARLPPAGAAWVGWSCRALPSRRRCCLSRCARWWTPCASRRWAALPSSRCSWMCTTSAQR